MEKDYTKNIYFVLLTGLVILLGFIFKTLSAVMLPVIIASLVSCVLAPIIQKINNKIKIPWVVLSILLTFLLVIAILGISTLLATSITAIVSEYPKYESKFLTIYKIIAENFSLEFDEGKSFFENIWKYFKVREYVQNFAISLSSVLVTSGKNLFLILILLLFLLFEFRLTNKKINFAFVGRQKKTVLRVLKRIVYEIVRYISVKFYISLATGIIVFFVCLCFGMNFPIVWAFLAFIMNFIPTFGSIFSVFITSLFALVQFYPSATKTTLILIFMILINFSLGNIVEPRIQGKNLGLSPFVILVSLSLWGYIWGIVGMFLAVPMTVIIKIICEHISYLHVFAILLGNDPNETRKDIEKEDEND